MFFSISLIVFFFFWSWYTTQLFISDLWLTLRTLFLILRHFHQIYWQKTNRSCNNQTPRCDIFCDFVFCGSYLNPNARYADTFWFCLVLSHILERRVYSSTAAKLLRDTTSCTFTICIAACFSLRRAIKLLSTNRWPSAGQILWSWAIRSLFGGQQGNEEIIYSRTEVRTSMVSTEVSRSVLDRAFI
jgi:hypothetical protein